MWLVPVTDEWGTFITALVPIEDPDGKLIAVMGMDIYAANWYWNIAARISLPFGLILCLVFLLMLVYFNTSHHEVIASLKPVRYRLMIPLTIVLVLLIGGFGFIQIKTFVDNERKYSLHYSEKRKYRIKRHIENAIKESEST